MGRKKKEEAGPDEKLSEELRKIYVGKNAKESVIEIEKKYSKYHVQSIKYGKSIKSDGEKNDRIRIWEDENENVRLIYVG
jgi:hypothetical protein